MSLPLSHDTTNSTLSLRAGVAEADCRTILWDVASDPWEPFSNPAGWVNVGVAENMLMQDLFLERIRSIDDIPARYLTYNHGGFGSLELRTSAADFLNGYFKSVVPLESTHVVATNGVTAGVEHLSWAFADPDEGILIGTPYYGNFVADISLRPGVHVVPVNFEGCDPFTTDSVQKYEKALVNFQQTNGKRVRALILCNPHNPLGRCYPKAVLIYLLKLCQKYQIHFISDEIYGLSVWENTVDTCPSSVGFESVLSIDKNNVIDDRLVHVLWGMSKDFGVNGLRIGFIISQANKQLHAVLKGVTLYSYISGISDFVTASILQDRDFTDWYLALNRQKLAQSYCFVTQKLKEYGIEYAEGCNAGFFIWVNLGKKYLDACPERAHSSDVGNEIMQRLVEKKVILADGRAFGSEKPGWFRIVFAHQQEHMEEAFRRLISALQG